MDLRLRVLKNLVMRIGLENRRIYTASQKRRALMLLGMRTCRDRFSFTAKRSLPKTEAQLAQQLDMALRSS